MVGNVLTISIRALPVGLVSGGEDARLPVRNEPESFPMSV